MTDDSHLKGGFVSALISAWIKAGKPTYQELGKIAERALSPQSAEGVRFVPLPRATTWDILHGQRKRPPKWAWVHSFLTALQVAAQQNGIDPAVVGSLDEWKQRHDALMVLQTARIGDDRDEADTQLKAVLGLLDAADEPRGRHSGPDNGQKGLELYRTMESRAEGVRIYEPGRVPGQLQTAGYAGAVIARQRPDATPEEVARLASQRVQRRQTRRDQEPLHWWVLIDEAALRSQWADAQVMQAQIRHLLSLTHEPRIALQVVPTQTADAAAVGEPMAILRFRERFLGDFVWLEQPDGLTYLYKRDDTEHYNVCFNNLLVKALSPDDTRRMLRDILGEV